MDTDIENKISRLCMRYLQAEGRVHTLRPISPPTSKEARRIQAQTIDALTELQVARKGPSASLVKLAYVRGMRSKQANAHMTEIEESEVDFLERRLHQDLNRVEVAALNDLTQYLRRMKLVTTLKSQDYPDVTLRTFSRDNVPYPLEQYARASIRTIVNTAFRAGESAAVPASEYHSGEHAHG